MLGALYPSNWPDWFGQASFALGGLSYLVRDMLALRLLSLAGSLAGLAGNWFPEDGPRWPTVPWLLLFVAVNLFQAAILLRERRTPSLSEEEAELHHAVFPNFTLAEYRKLLRIGDWRTLTEGTILAEDGHVPDEIFVVANGSLSAEHGGIKVRELRDGAMIGELALLTHRPMGATIRAISDVRCLVWPRRELTRLLVRNPLIALELQRAFVISVAGELVGPGTQIVAPSVN